MVKEHSKYLNNSAPTQLIERTSTYSPVFKQAVKNLICYISESDYYYLSYVKNFNVYNFYDERIFYCKFEDNSLLIGNLQLHPSKEDKFDFFAHELPYQLKRHKNGKKVLHIDSASEIESIITVLKKIEQNDNRNYDLI